MPVFIAALGGMLINIVGSLVGRVLVALGMAVVTYTGVNASLEAMKTQAIQSFAALPAGPVKAGDTWQQQLTIPNPLGAMTATMVNTSRGQEALDGRSLARFTTTTTLKPSGAPAAMPGRYWSLANANSANLDMM